MQQYASLASPLGEQLRFSSLHAVESLSQPFTFKLKALGSRADIDFHQLLGQHVTVSLALAPEVSAEPRHFDGIVERVGLVGRTQRDYEYQLVLRPWFWFLSHTQDCRIFQNQTVLEIIDAVLADHPIAALRKRTTAAYTPWPYCVQYRESDFHFLSRLMEQEGIVYHFAHEAGKHTLVLGDSVTAYDLAPGCAALPVRHGDAAADSRGQECVFDFSCSQSVQPGAVVMTDYDFTRPRVDLTQGATHSGAHALGDYEHFDYPGTYDRRDDGEHFAHTRMEAHAAATLASGGLSDARALACGSLVHIQGSVRPSDDTEYLVLATDIAVSQPAHEGGGGDTGPGYRCRFEALPSNVTYRSPRHTRKPTVQGPQTAVVVGPEGDEIHTDKFGRVKVQFHWDRYGQKNEKSSCWVRVSSPWAGKSFGFMQVPRIGQEVVVDFLEGDPDQPLITGRVYNAEQMPPWELPANATQSGVLTRSSKGGHYGQANALRFEDKKGEEQLWLHAEKDQLTEVEHDEDKWVGNDRRKTIDGHETTVVKKNRTETVGIDETIHVGANRSEHVGANETIAIGANRSEAVAAHETITIGANRSVTIGGNKSEHVAIAKSETIGAAKALSIGAAYQVTVGGLMNTTVGGFQAQEVGLYKATLVGGDYTIKTGASLAVTATREIRFTVGKASIVMKADGTIALVGTEIYLNGKTVDLVGDAHIGLESKRVDFN